MGNINLDRDASGILQGVVEGLRATGRPHATMSDAVRHLAALAQSHTIPRQEVTRR